MKYLYNKFKEYIGHNIVCVAYGDIENLIDIYIECEDCGYMLMSVEGFDKD